jgi:hypothetical protein
MRGDLIWLNAFARQLYIDKNQIEF